MYDKWKNFTRLICKDLTFTISFTGFIGCLLIVLTTALLMHGDPEEKLVSNVTGVLVVFFATIFGVAFWWWMSFKCTALANQPYPEFPPDPVAEPDIATIAASIPQSNQTVIQWLKNLSDGAEALPETSTLPSGLPSDPDRLDSDTTSLPDPPRRDSRVILSPDGIARLSARDASSSERSDAVGLRSQFPTYGATNLTYEHDVPTSSSGGDGGRRSVELGKEPDTTSRRRSQTRSKSPKPSKGILKTPTYVETEKM